MAKKTPKVIQKYIDSGIHIEEFNEQRRGNNLKNCLWNAFLNFMFVSSALGLLINAFDLTCSYLVVFGCVAFLSVYMGLLYMNSWTFNIMYILMPFWIIPLAISMYRVANSGFSALLNLIFIKIDEIMNLTNIRTYTEFYPNRYVSLTVCLCLISIIFVIIANKWISRRQSILHPFFWNLILVEICVYLDNSLSYTFFIMLIISFILYIITKQNDNQTLIYKKKYIPYKIKKKTVYLRSGEVNKKSNIIISLTLSLFILGVSLILTSSLSDVYLNSSSNLKKTSDKYVYQVAAFGFESLFNNSTYKNNQGSISNGDVIHDNETDIVVDFVPHSYEPLYIPNYVGDYYNFERQRWESKQSGLLDYNYLNRYYNYSSNYFLTDDQLLNNKKNENYDEEKAQLLKYINGYDSSNMILEYLYLSSNEKAAKTSATIKNVDNNISTTSLYYSIETLAQVYLNSYYTFEYFPNNYEYDELNSIYKSVDIKKLNAEQKEKFKLYVNNIKAINNYVKEDYLTYTPEMEKVLKKISDKQNFSNMSYSDYNASTELEIIKQIQKYYIDNYAYKRSLKNIKYDDPIMNFLGNSHEGYCVHFASGAVELLRYLGVPARYVEGYDVSFDILDDITNEADIIGNLENGKKTFENLQQDKDVSEYVVYDGYNELGVNNIIEVDVTDMSAHAWVEVYIYNFGWVPFEFTLADPDVERGDYESILERLMSSSDGFFNDDSVSELTETFTNENFEVVVKTGFLFIVSGVAVIVILYLIYKIVYHFYSLYWCEKSKRAINQYRKLCSNIKLLLINKNKKEPKAKEKYGELLITHNDLYELYKEHVDVNNEKAKKYIDKLLKFNYSGQVISKEDSKELTKLFKFINKQINKKLPIYKRIIKW